MVVDTILKQKVVVQKRVSTVNQQDRRNEELSDENSKQQSSIHFYQDQQEGFAKTSSRPLANNLLNERTKEVVQTNLAILFD
jgi:hypothetical protein